MAATESQSFTGPSRSIMAGRWPRIFDLLALAFIIALGWPPRMQAASTYDRPLDSEEHHYHDYAIPWVKGEGTEPREKAFPWHPLGSFTHRPPGYVLMVGTVYRWAGLGNLQAVRVVQAAMDTLSLCLLYALGILVWGPGLGRAIGLISAAVMARYDFLLLFVTRLLSETFFVFLCLSFLCLAMLALRRRRPGISLVAGYVLGWAAITRPLVILVLPAYLLWLGVAPQLGQRRRHLALAALGILLAVGPVTVRNWQLQGRFILISTNGGQVLHDSLDRVDNLSAPEDLPTRDQLKAPGLGEVDLQAAYRDAALGYMRRHPGDLPRILERKLRVLLVSKDEHTISHQVMKTPWDPWLYPTVLILALLGLGIRPRMRWHPRLLLLITLGGQLLVCLLTNAEVRYRVPFIPLLTLLAGGAVLLPFYRPSRPAPN